MITTRILQRMDWLLVSLVIAVSLFGVLMVAGSMHNSWEAALASEFFRSQVVWVLAGIVLMFAVTILDYRYLRHVMPVIYGVNIALLVGVIYRGVEAGGARRWLHLGPLGLQPSELAKVLVIITLAHFLAGKEEDGPDTGWCAFALSALHVALPAALVLIQPDLGTSLVFVAIWFGSLYFAGFLLIRLLGVFALGMGTAVGAVVAHVRYAIEVPFLRDHMVARLISFLDPSLDPTGAGYQLKQSILAIGSGGMTGNGLFRGASSQLNFLPEQHTDFIFSAIGEQLGFVGTTGLLVAFTLILLRMLLVLIGAKDRFGTILVGGVIAYLFFHVLVNVGMTMGVMPVTGLPLPFISYGRSAFLSEMIAVGLVLNVGGRRIRERIRF